MPHARINGFDMYYERHGNNGDPLVLVHGYTGDIHDWQHQVETFAPTHRVLVLDHRGHGRSSAPEDRGSYTIAQMATDVEALVEAVGFQRYHLVGHSMGGAVAQEIALRSAASLLSLTLEDTAPVFAFPRNENIQRYIDQRMRMADEQGMPAVAEIPSLVPDPPHMPPGRREFEKQRLSAMSPHGFIGAWQALQSWAGTRDRLDAIAAPTLAICGELDVPLVEPMKSLAAAIPACELVIIEQAAHSPQIERPHAFNEALSRHLQRNAART